MIAFDRALATLARPGDNMTKTLLLAALGVTALIVNPFFGCQAVYHYDAADMRIAIEGTWQLQVAGKPDVTLTIKQAAKAEQHATSATLVRSASACSHRSFVRSAEACKDISEMPLAVELAGMTTKTPPKGSFVVPSTEFSIGNLNIELDDALLEAKITPTGTVESASIWGGHGSGSTPVSLVRVRQPNPETR
jgi:hypothetical protein